MTIGVCVVLALIVIALVLMYAGAVAIERRWSLMHPPDDWDGVREDDADDDA